VRYDNKNYAAGVYIAYLVIDESQAQLDFCAQKCRDVDGCNAFALTPYSDGYHRCTLNTVTYPVDPADLGDADNSAYYLESGCAPTCGTIPDGDFETPEPAPWYPQGADIPCSFAIHHDTAPGSYGSVSCTAAGSKAVESQIQNLTPGVKYTITLSSQRPYSSRFFVSVDGYTYIDLPYTSDGQPVTSTFSFVASTATAQLRLTTDVLAAFDTSQLATVYDNIQISGEFCAAS
jgi:hypothetical protein